MPLCACHATSTDDHGPNAASRRSTTSGRRSTWVGGRAPCASARRCLQICDRGYVLDQGRDAYTGTGRELLNDPKVIGLYLGTLGT